MFWELTLTLTGIKIDKTLRRDSTCKNHNTVRVVGTVTVIFVFERKKYTLDRRRVGDVAGNLYVTDCAIAIGSRLGALSFRCCQRFMLFPRFGDNGLYCGIITALECGYQSIVGL